MDLLGLLVLLIVAAVVGALGEMIGGVKVPGGWIGSILAGLIGAWIGSAIFHFGPVIGGIQILPAIVGAILFVLVLRLLLDSRRGRAV
ncbi:MAG: GlsB/YeaQ/YmgE family stress response membrane protein [Actinomycetota bacterium]